MGHEGLEPSANGLRVQRETRARRLFAVISGRLEAAAGHDGALSGHGVPVLEAARALVAMVAAGDDRPFDAALDVVEAILASDTSNFEVPAASHDK